MQMHTHMIKQHSCMHAAYSLAIKMRIIYENGIDPKTEKWVHVISRVRHASFLISFDFISAFGTAISWKNLELTEWVSIFSHSKLPHAECWTIKISVETNVFDFRMEELVIIKDDWKSIVKTASTQNTQMSDWNDSFIENWALKLFEHQSMVNLLICWHYTFHAIKRLNMENATINRRAAIN